MGRYKGQTGRSLGSDVVPVDKVTALLTGIQLLSSGAKLVPLIFYELHSIALDIH
jgi:hypothetical protein